MPPATRKRFSRLPATQQLGKSPKPSAETSPSFCRRSKRLQTGSPDSDLENNNPAANQMMMDIATPTKSTGRSSSKRSSSTQQSSPRSASSSRSLTQSSHSPDIPSLLLKAKSLFRLSALPPRLVGRDQERQAIQKFLDGHIGSSIPASLYISGAPGTGKTALVEQLLKTHFGGHKNKRNIVGVVQLNCMAVGEQPRSIFQKILERIDPKAAADSSMADCAKLVEAAVSQRSKKHWLIMLDEIDQLLTRDQEVLYRIFEWPMLKQSKCCVIGIANALDLTQRFLPRLIAKNRAPVHVAFAPYTAGQISEIIINRLESLSDLSGTDSATQSNNTTQQLLMQRPAIELCARKVAAIGDLRKALDICRQSIELMEREYRQQSLVGSPLANKTRENIPPLLPKVTVQHVLRVINATFGAANPSLVKIRGLTTQQKMALVVMSAMQQQGTQLTVSRAFDGYVTVCRRSNLMDPLARSQFFEIISAIESTGLISLMRKATTPVKKMPSTAVLANADSTPKQRPMMPKLQSTGRGTPGSASRGMKAGAIIDADCRLGLTVNQEEIGQGVQNVPFLMELLAAPEILASYLASN